MSKTAITELETQVRSFITENFHVAASAHLDRDTSLLDTGLVDSTGYLEIFKWLREDYEIEVQSHEMNPNNFETIARIAVFIQARQA